MLVPMERRKDKADNPSDPWSQHTKRCFQDLQSPSNSAPVRTNSLMPSTGRPRNNWLSSEDNQCLAPTRYLLLGFHVTLSPLTSLRLSQFRCRAASFDFSTDTACGPPSWSASSTEVSAARTTFDKEGAAAALTHLKTPGFRKRPPITQ